MSTAEVLETFKSEGLRLGVVTGFVYGSPLLNAYVAENSDSDLIVFGENSVINLRRLLNGDIDGLVEDRLSIIDTTWRFGAFGKVAEIPLDSFADISMMLSKANFTPDAIANIDNVLSNMSQEGAIEGIAKSFLFPLFFSQTTGSTWYGLVDLVGTVAFAISGTILGWRIGANIAGFFILSALPAIGGGMVRDIILGRSIASLDSYQNITIIAVISVAGYTAYRLSKRMGGGKSVGPVYATLFNALDAAGLGSFTVTGVAVTIADVNQHPLVWAPFVGVLTATGGGIARDALVQRKSPVLFDDLYTQISLFWGGVLTIYVYLTPVRIEPHQYRDAMWVTVLAIIVTRVIWLYRQGKLAVL